MSPKQPLFNFCLSATAKRRILEFFELTKKQISSARKEDAWLIKMLVSQSDRLKTLLSESEYEAEHEKCWKIFRDRFAREYQESVDKI